MIYSFEDKPDTWDDWTDMKTVGSDVYYKTFDVGIVVGGKATHLWVWHWHTPTEGEARWQASGCGLHNVVSVEPLTLDPSLACHAGCPWHGWIQNGEWRPC